MNTRDRLRRVISSKPNEIAFVIGNGINRFGEPENHTSWDDLLLKLWQEVYGGGIKAIPSGISMTEFYDLMELEISSRKRKLNLQKKFCDQMASWSYQPHHEKIVNKAKTLGTPILTTNFETIMSESGGLAFNRFKNRKFTDFYPWECYYSEQELSSPLDGFGLWHINGMEKYYRSIRLGLTHYMGSVEKARGYIHRGKGKRLFSGRNQQLWRGKDTWLQIIFNKSLFIFGLGLEENEVFLRWLLIERARYFRKFPNRARDGWYVTVSGQANSGKRLFLQNLGFDCVELNSYEELYEGLW